MGLSVEFYAGDPEEIGDAFTEIELEGLRDGSFAHSYADLSLHLSLTDFDVFSKEVGETLGRSSVLLLESLERCVGGTPDESEAFVVSSPWVAAVAGVPSEAATALTTRWLQAVAAESGEDVVIDSPDASAAVSSLIALCRELLARNTSVVFAWYL